MRVILSKYSGFCFGVGNALKITEQTIDNNAGQKVYLLGSLVHNEEVINKLKEKNIKIVKKINEIPNGALVILSAHGHSPKIYQQAKDKNLKIIDATCPKVVKVHILGKMLAQQGYFVIIVGDKNHQEVKAIFEQIKSAETKQNPRIKIVENIQQAKKLKFQPKIAVVSQTTQSLESFSAIIGEISKHTDELRICNTICEATRFRQTAADRLAKKVDLMIVVGSFASANTKRLTSLCQEIVKTYQVNKAGDLKKEWFKNKNLVGICAGASTPEWIIKEVINKIRGINV